MELSWKCEIRNKRFNKKIKLNKKTKYIIKNFKKINTL